MADPGTCEQCGVTNSNRTNIVLRHSKSRIVCQSCYDKENPPVVETVVEGKEDKLKSKGRLSK